MDGVFCGGSRATKCSWLSRLVRLTACAYVPPVCPSPCWRYPLLRCLGVRRHSIIAGRGSQEAPSQLAIATNGRQKRLAGCTGRLDGEVWRKDRRVVQDVPHLMLATATCVSLIITRVVDVPSAVLLPGPCDRQRQVERCRRRAIISPADDSTNCWPTPDVVQQHQEAALSEDALATAYHWPVWSYYINL